MRCFEILRLNDTATEYEVKRAYRLLAAEMHPDHGGDPVSFHTLHLAYTQALAVAAEPLTCPECHGVGKKTISSGWSSVHALCPRCGGCGTTPRKETSPER